ncbi:MAG: aminopeptidase N [Deltaproteobacteria bacterium]|nr:aminopeptidase N [Deltaproteobacteria bacterium]
MTDVSDSKPQAVLRAAYRDPDYLIDTVDLDFDLAEDQTRVEARLGVRRRRDAPLAGHGDVPLVLDGEDLELREIEIDGRALADSEYGIENDQLTIFAPPERFVLRTVVVIHPETNTQLSGLYKSSGNFCTQCEAMGFRRITWFMDRPDVMARYTVAIEADRERYPVLLSNGNRVALEERAKGRHRVCWEDPFPKPSYLFALVAGDLRCHAGEFVTMSGRTIKLEIWVEPQNIDRCDHALRSLKRAMKWDEERFGREYDLDIYMIVAVSDFNMGAMENKGLNIFNSKYVLALPETATDDDYEGIEAVIAHEYFHNWTGNRVTCRDWFQLTLKEGLTVYRDQRFSEEMTSAAVNRIANVKMLRARQFPEDEGPMAHPIRPESYISMDNFYTATVYEKGSEVIRMYAALLGEDGFRKGMDCYFDRHDGQAVTCDDFRAAMADANGCDLGQFERWYLQAGTPRLRARGEYDEVARSYTLTLAQDYPETAFEIPGADERKPLHLPVAVGLLDEQGAPIPLVFEDEVPRTGETTRILELREAEQRFVFESVDALPIPSLLRGFSAPVRFEMERSRESLAFLMAHDEDPFNRWDAGQQLALDLLVAATAEIERGAVPPVDEDFLAAWGRVLVDESLDGSLRALALMLPAERVIAQEMETIRPDSIHSARELLGGALAKAHADTLWSAYEALGPMGPYRHEKEAIDRRRLRATVLRSLAWTGDEAAIEAAWAQFEAADSMTDAQGAFVTLADQEHARRDEVIESFFERWKEDPLVLDKWFSIQAGSKRADTLGRVKQLSEHADFTLGNPNRVRALVGAFCAGNQVRFHDATGEGYVFLADAVLALDGANPQVASRMASIFNDWRRYDDARQSAMQAQLDRIASSGSLSKDVYEIVSRALSR